jgi:hypothetical protein
MSFAESFLEEFDPEMAATRRMLERLPASKLDWKPHAKSKSLGELATHITELPRWGMRIHYLRLNDVPLPAVYGPTADEAM